MSSKFKVSKKAKTISWKNGAEYIVISTNTNKSVETGEPSEPLPFDIKILITEKGSWKSTSLLPNNSLSDNRYHNGSASYDKIVEIKESRGERHVLMATDNVVVLDKNKKLTIGGNIGEHHNFGFDTVVIPPSLKPQVLKTKKDPDWNVLSALPSYREDMIKDFDSGVVVVNGQQYKITAEEGTSYFEESADTDIIDEISAELKKAVANEVRNELETWLDEKDLWYLDFFEEGFESGEYTLDEIMSKIPVYYKITRAEMNNGSGFQRQIARHYEVSNHLHIPDTATDETKVITLHREGFSIDYSINSGKQLHWDSEQETWAIRISTSMTLNQIYSFSFPRLNRIGNLEQLETKTNLHLSTKENVRLIPLSFDYRDGCRSMVKELVSLGDFSEIKVTGPDGKAAPGIQFADHCYVFDLKKELDKQPEWLKNIIDLNPQARRSKSKSVSQNKPISAASPPSVQQHGTVSSQNHIGGNSEFNWQIVETLQRIAEAVERIADKNDP